ncbi:PHP domain-containing protein [Haloglomus litoreum]|uniref:PHP domain-containing protein n=1 Tax=Haloglomus litoreum TaxID=3034026 RepID=UPI0023E75894|nr:PHP domain-containing protein [Haloglomus sp. DT116]
MVVADLHAHTTNSDGEMTLEEIPAAARRAGVEAVAVTDHDRLHPELDAPTTERDGVTVVHGIELRVESPAGRVDLLGYGVRETPELADLVEHLQRDRVERGRAMVERVESRLGVDLDVTVEPGFGRPDLARAVVAVTDYEFDEVFDELIADGRPCYVSRDIPSFDDGRAILAEACALVGLAHPFRYEDPEAALTLTADLDAVERYYPYEFEPDVAPVAAAVEANDLLVTGGSDAHDHRLGRAGLDGDEWAAVRRRLPDPQDSSG